MNVCVSVCMRALQKVLFAVYIALKKPKRNKKKTKRRKNKFLNDLKLRISNNFYVIKGPTCQPTIRNREPSFIIYMTKTGGQLEKKIKRLYSTLKAATQWHQFDESL